MFSAVPKATDVAAQTPKMLPLANDKSGAASEPIRALDEIQSTALTPRPATGVSNASATVFHSSLSTQSVEARLKQLFRRFDPLPACPVGFYDWAEGPAASPQATAQAAAFAAEKMPAIGGQQGYRLETIACGQSGFGSFKLVADDGSAFHIKLPNEATGPATDIAQEAAVGRWVALMRRGPEVVHADGQRKLLVTRWIANEALNPHSLRTDFALLGKIFCAVRTLHTAHRSEVPKVGDHDPLANVRQSLRNLKDAQTLSSADFSTLDAYAAQLNEALGCLPYDAGLVHNDFHHNNVKLTEDGEPSPRAKWRLRHAVFIERTQGAAQSSRGGLADGPDLRLPEPQAGKQEELLVARSSGTAPAPARMAAITCSWCLADSRPFRARVTLSDAIFRGSL